MLLQVTTTPGTPLITQPVVIFLMVMAIIVLVPVLLSRWKVPGVIGLILAGVLVGPYGVNLLARDMSFQVFGDVGILYLMFLAGLEIDMLSLRRNLGKGLTFGLLTFAIPLILGTLVAVSVLGMSRSCGLLLGSMFAAHTLIAYPIVKRFGITRNSAVVVAVAGTIVAVLGALVVLAAVTSGLGRDDSYGMIKLIVGLILFCIVVLYAYPRLARWFFKTFTDGILQFVWVLVLVFLAASVANWIGIEGVFGAFFAGLVLNRYIPLRSVLMSRLEFVGNALFIPYFLIGVGMFINIRVIFAGWDTLYVAGVMIAVAVAGKWLAALITQKLFRYSSAERSILYQLSNAHTAVALAVVMIGYQLELFGDEVLNGTVLMILVTCCISSIGAERAAAKIKLHMVQADFPGEDKQKALNQQEKIIVTVANPITVPSLVETALLMRRQNLFSSEIIALHVRNEDSPVARQIGKDVLDNADKTGLAANCNITTVERFDINVTTGVLNALRERDASSVIIGMHRRGNLIDSFLGDKIEQLVHNTSKMVVITRCFIPVSTITRMLVTVPDRAEHESGFRQWVESLGFLGQEIGCRVIFCCHASARPFIRAIISQAHINVRAEFRIFKTLDDLILMSNKILIDDLLVIVSARRTSLSYASDMEIIPEFIEKNLTGTNLIMLYPEQTGNEPTLTMAGAMSSESVASPSQLWLLVMARYRLARQAVKRWLKK